MRILHAHRLAEPHRLRRWLAALLFVAALPVAAQQTVQTMVLGQRVPAEARHGVMTYVNGFDVTLDQRPARLAPGALIRDTRNFVIFPPALPAGAKVAYLVDDQGAIFRVWVLTPDEAARYQWTRR